MRSTLTQRLPLLLAGCAAATLLATGTATADTGSSGSSSGSSMLSQLECRLIGLSWDANTQRCTLGMTHVG
ncbi:hypothetical protein [Nocardia heshunensis]